MRGAGFVFGRKLDRPWLSPSGTADVHLRVHYSKLGHLLKVVHEGKKIMIMFILNRDPLITWDHR